MTAPPLAIPPDVTLFCDPALAPAMRRLDGPSRRRIGVPVAVLSAPAPLLLAQIERHTRNDVLFTLSAAMDEAVRRRLVAPATRLDGWDNRLVLAVRAGASRPAASRPAASGLAAWLASRRVAVTDPTVLAGLDGRAVLAGNDLRPGAVIGAANTGDAAFLVTTGAADAALVYQSDVEADPRLALLAPLSADAALTRFSGAVNARARSPRARDFLTFLGGAAGPDLRAAGLALPA